MVCHWFTLGRPAAHGEGSFPPEPSLDGQGNQGYSFHLFAGVTQLVECQLPKLNVAGSSPVARSGLQPSSHTRAWSHAIMDRGHAELGHANLPSKRVE